MSVATVKIRYDICLQCDPGESLAERVADAMIDIAPLIKDGTLSNGDHGAAVVGDISVGWSAEITHGETV